MFSRRPHFFKLCSAALAGMFLLAGISAGYSADPPPATPAAKMKSMRTTPVNFTANSLTHDDENQTVTAIGNVELVQGQQILRADKMVYYLDEDKVTAIGNVSLLDERGDVSFAEYVELKDQMKDGFIQGLLSLLADGSRFTAETAKRENNGMKTTMTDATYTPCKVCENDPHPLWQIKAGQIVHNEEDKTVDYKNAWLDFAGVPFLYSPIFWHPDPTEKQKSGFLRPQYGWSDDLGTHVQGGYYYAVAPDKDLTMQVEPTSLAGTILKGEWRERFDNGQLNIDGSAADSNRDIEDGTISSDRVRGNIFANGLFDINNEWRSGFDLQRASDKQYLNYYDISNNTAASYQQAAPASASTQNTPMSAGAQNTNAANSWFNNSNENSNVLNNNYSGGVLTSDVYAERFAGRDYSRISAMSFDDLRVGIEPPQPDIIPMMEHTMIGEPNALWGGRWELGASALGLYQDADYQNEQRGSLSAGWERRGTSTSGFSNVVSLNGRSDFYGVQSSDLALNSGENNTIARGMATAGMISSYPLIKPLDNGQVIVEPVAGINISPEVGGKNSEIPDEDSQDVQLDVDNLFQPNRYPGIDRQEDGGRANYGIRTGLYGDDGKYGRIFLGESYRLYGASLYPEGSGLETRRSDIVGQVKLGLSKYLDADYRVQLDSDTLAVRRHELQAGGGDDRFRLNVRYFYLAPVAGLTPVNEINATDAPDFNDIRQQIETDGSYNLTSTWRLHAADLVDLGVQPGLRSATTGIEYTNECFSYGLEGSRIIADTVSGDNQTTIMLHIAFRGLGEFSPGVGR
jgi:LPS-assembly protein